MQTRRALNRAFIWPLLILFISSIACGQSTADKLSEAAKEATAAPQKTAPLVTTDAITNAGPEKTAESVKSAPEPTKEPTPLAQEMILGDSQGFIQDGIEVVSIFTVENPNKNFAIESTPYQITTFDSSGAVLNTETGYIEIIMPEEKLAFATNFYLDEGQVADKVEIQLDNGEPVWMDQNISAFSVDKLFFIPDQNFPKISGVVENNLSYDVTEVKLTAVAYDDQDQIIGGGYTYVNFVPGSSKTGVDVSVSTKATPVRVELYPTLSGLSDLDEPAEDEVNLDILRTGFGQASSELGVGYVIENTNAQNAIESSMYRVAAYDEIGNVLASDSGYISLILPGEKLGNFTSMT